MKTKKRLSIYIHIPFCIQKCLYCDFLSAPAGRKTRRAYVEALLREIEAEASGFTGSKVDTVFIGGGTPSLLEAEEIRRILDQVRFCLPAKDVAVNPPEITIEVNPGTVTREKLAACRRAGINRLSIGLQSAADVELKALGRIHSAADFFDTFEAARQAGFENINVDIMSALPQQSISSYEATLRRTAALAPEHLSAYSLIVEEGTHFFEQQQHNKLNLPSEEEERQMYELTGRLLEEYGYHRYEISNYAREGGECRHNKVYWQRGDYLGFGLGASSMAENVRWNNTRELAVYINQAGITNIKENRQVLTTEEQMEEFMFLGLRLLEGIGREAFYRYFHRDLEEVYGQVLERLQRDGLVTVDDRVRLTPYGVDISNYVLAQFLF